MNHIIFFAGALLFASLFASPVHHYATTASSAETYVYICTGPKSQCYHRTSECKGLDRCSKDVQRVTQAYAEEKGRRKCSICYPSKKN